MSQEDARKGPVCTSAHAEHEKYFMLHYATPQKPHMKITD
jgi:hypothetical protein